MKYLQPPVDLRTTAKPLPDLHNSGYLKSLSQAAKIVLIGLPDYKQLLLKLPGAKTVLGLLADLEGRRFDRENHIQTLGDVETAKMHVPGSNAAHGIHYNPTSLRAGRHVFEELPIADFTQYTFVDFGSGKGRMLFLAAEYPFHRIIGVEYASDLHVIAEQNIRSYRNPRQRCSQLSSVNIDAANFEFPRENSVLYFYFPFRRPVMEPLIQRLDESIGQYPRDVIIVYLNPELSEIIERTRHFKIINRGPYYTIYRT
jgi:hypothetical protein